MDSTLQVGEAQLQMTCPSFAAPDEAALDGGGDNSRNDASVGCAAEIEEQVCGAVHGQSGRGAAVDDHE